MEPIVRQLHALVADLEPVDDLEAEHQRDVLHWLENSDDIFRRRAPMTPSKHLVSYFVPIDAAGSAVLLVDHIKAGRWLPPGGHVEPGEHPREAVRREAREELGMDAAFADPSGDCPCFVTVSETRYAENRHTDVSLWFVLRADPAQRLSPDLGEFRQLRWWSMADIVAADPMSFDPHFGRMLTKIGILPKPA
jgi:8-oxo-dGTP diphosphatase